MSSSLLKSLMDVGFARDRRADASPLLSGLEKLDDRAAQGDEEGREEREKMKREFQFTEAHAPWSELCALATTRALEPTELERLQLHLESCAACRASLEDYQTMACEGIALVADVLAPFDEDASDLPAWDQEGVQRKLFSDLATIPAPPAIHVVSAKNARGRLPPTRSAGWTRLALVLRAGLAIFLLVAVGLGAYRLGRNGPTPSAARSETLSGRLKHADPDYLASDRDIRELMSARQLSIAAVTDMDATGNRLRPFGRVLYAKGKSLVFYAFDLDPQAEGPRTSIFQAWAREGSDKAQPVSLGMFHVDSEQDRCWVLKADDLKVLAKINSIFVTVEPKGGSPKPTGKPLLYAYLKSEAPNRP